MALVAEAPDTALLGGVRVAAAAVDALELDDAGAHPVVAEEPEPACSGAEASDAEVVVKALLERYGGLSDIARSEVVGG